MPLKGHPSEWAEGSKIAVIRDAVDAEAAHVKVRLQNGKVECRECSRAARSLYDSVGTAPLTYSAGGKVLPQGKERWRRFMNEVREIHAYLNRGEWVADAPASEPSPEPQQPVSEPDPEPVRVPAPKPAPAGVRDAQIEADVKRFQAAVAKHRAFARARNLECLDSMRITLDGVKAIFAGVPVEALVASIQAPWEDLTRQQFAGFTPTPQQMRPAIPAGSFDYSGFKARPSKFAHGVSEYVAALVKANVPVWLHGPAGTGKSSAAKHAAELHAQNAGLIGREACEGRWYFEVNLAGAMVSSVKGRDRLKEFVESDFMLAYEHGGTVCLEEFDAAHPSVGTFLGTALASPDGFSNDAMGRFVKRHPDFRVIVTANSLGYGDAKFKRSQLDAATIDRFRMGRCYTGLDTALETTIVEAMVEKYFAQPV